ncbi:MAG TPA: hypothetical protein VLA33_08385 [Gemmatimonadota bacterium]|nr:hypothetical protein [Gemmatimonadota bacterium]
MTDEQRLEDELIVRAAREAYNAPPETPRDDMWAVIEARLEAGMPAPDRVARARAAHARTMGRLSWWMGVAAALVIGLGIGRLSLGTGESEPKTASHSAGSEVAEPATTEIPLAGLPEAEGAPDTTSPGGRTVRSTGDASPESPREPTTAMRDGGTNPAPYATATRAHLSRSETFLAGVRVDLAAGSTDAEFEAWARSLLSRTRLLLASPAGRNPETRRLLEDLELMLAQVVMTASTSDPAEVRLLGEGLEQGDLLQRLRTSSL